MANDNWCTPPEILAPVRRFKGEIHLDPCSNSGSLANAKRSFTVVEDGLKQPWELQEDDVCWVNPPYSRGQKLTWINRVILDYIHGKGAHYLMLLPIDTSTEWWEKADQFMKARCDIKFRVKFIDYLTGERAGTPAFASTVLYFGRDVQTFASTFREIGYIYIPV